MPTISGSLTLISGSLEIPSGSLIGTASYATAAEQLSGVQTAIVNIDSGSYNDLLLNPLNLISVSPNTYLEGQVVFEFDDTANNGWDGGYLYLYAGSGLSPDLNYGILPTQGVKSFATVPLYPTSDSNGYPLSISTPIGENIYLGVRTSNNTTFNGTLRAIITYTTRTFGT